MMTISAKYNKKTNGVNVKYSAKGSCTLEHYYAIVSLLNVIKKNDVEFDIDKDLATIKEMFEARKEK